MIVNREHRFVFLGVPRTGSTSMSAALIQIPGSRELGKHLMVIKKANWRNFFTFACVRNPYARELSHFKYRRSKKANALRQYCEHWSFEEYATWTTDDSAEPLGFHDYPQHELLGAKRVDHVIKFENMQADWANLGVVSNIPALNNLELPVSNASAARGTGSLSITEAAANKIYDWARVDFERYGYDKESWRDM